MSEAARQSSPEPSVRHKTSDVSIRLLALSALGLVALMLASLAIVEGMDRWLTTGSAGATAAMDQAPEARAPRATPVLDPEQTMQRQRYEARQRHQLSSYGWVDRPQGIARIPIQRAMELLAEEAEEAP